MVPTIARLADPALLNTVRARTSAGLTLQNSAGADVLLLGAGPGLGITAYGQINGTSLALSAGVTCTIVTASSSIGVSGNSPAAYLAIGVTNTASNGYAQVNFNSGTLAGSVNVATGLFYKFYQNGSVPWQWESASGVVATLTAAGTLTLAGSVPGTPSSSEVLIGGGAIKAGGGITAAADTDATLISGRFRAYSAFADVMMLSHYDRANTTDFALLQRADGTTDINSTGALAVKSAGSEVGRFDNSATAGHTRFLIYDVDNGTLERVTVGAADSGGSGFKLLRIPN